MVTLKDVAQRSASALENSFRCPKHHVHHTGSLCYLLDFYDFLGEIEKGKRHIEHLISHIVEDNGAWVFYPGHLDPMNMSQNVIDTGSAVDAISRFAWRNRNHLSEHEHERIRHALRPIVETYLSKASLEKHVTNQRLWGLTGLASWARYVGEENRYREVVELSIRQALRDMSADGFFYYVPRAKEVGMFSGYAGASAFYHSRCLAFIRYSASCVGLSLLSYRDQLHKADQALLALYDENGVKDMRVECKRWYWLSSYEVAATGFDSYALAESTVSESQTLMPHLLMQCEQHMKDGMLHAHRGAPVNFQCPIFWTAHIAWLLRINNSESVWATREDIRPFRFRLKGAEVFSSVTEKGRVWVSKLTSERNMTVGIYDNGLPPRYRLCAVPLRLPPRFLFSIRETANHVWCALRGGYVLEALARLWQLGVWITWIPLPVCSTHWGKVTSIDVMEDEAGGTDLVVTVLPGTLYGTLTKTPATVRIRL